MPYVRIICLINFDIKNEIIDGTIKICEHFNIEYIKLQNIDKIAGHPTVKGMEQIKIQILNSI